MQFVTDQKGVSMRNLIRLTQVETDPRTMHLFKRSTYYGWFHRRKHSEIFVKIGGTVFIDVDRLDQLIEKGRGKAA